MKYIIKESQYVYLLENMVKRKKLFINILGDDLITENEDRILRDKVKRRFAFIDQHVNELDRDDVCEYWAKYEVEDYVDSSMSNIVEQVCKQIGSFDLYDELYEYLLNNGYKSQFRDFFFDTRDNYCSK